MHRLPKVAEITGFSLRRIQRACRAGLLPHHPVGEGTKRVHRAMDDEQIAAMRTAWTIGSLAEPSTEPEPRGADVIAEAVLATRRHVRRNAGRERAA